ncbi:outer membrane protein [Helicobacter cetorum]|uniref:Outer membrane protein/porin n=1 Tax=Helicobacter cetorum (strain ATCC BAA-540 / CCUG 52418 / MIT 99-5656) TaxID=1163745 RepID=I0ER57_HELCM|nr:Outer membrane protein/porin [Helicobacter cetorum MIT 99-5656]
MTNKNFKENSTTNKEFLVKTLKQSLLAPLSLAAILSLSPLSAEEDGGFMTFGYELGQIVQSVKNPGKIKAEELARELNATKTINNSFQSIGGNVVGNLGNLFMNELQNLINLYPTLNSNQIQSSSSEQGCNGASGSSGSSGHLCFKGDFALYESMVSSVKNLESTIKADTQLGVTTPKLLAAQLGNINTLNTYMLYMNSFLKANNTPDGLKSFNITQTQEVSYIIQQALQFTGPDGDSGVIEAFLNATLAQQLFNSANAGNDLSAKRFTSLVQNIINTSANALQKGVNADISTKTGYEPSWSQGQGRRGSVEYLDNTQNTLDKITRLNNDLKAHPWLGNFAAGNSSQVNSFNGIYTKIGYKKFFGEDKNIGVRYYGFFSYNGAGVGNGPTYNQVNLLTYGVGVDALYNVFSRSFGSRSIDAGFFGGLQFAGDTYITTLRNSPQLVNKPTTTKFQFLFDLGMRMNFGILKKDLKKHHQHSIEIGVQIPTIYNTYYKSGGAEVKYYRPYSVYWVYGYAF